MSWSPKAPRIIRAAAPTGDVFVLGEGVPASLRPDGPLADAAELLRHAEEEARTILASAAQQAETLLADARAQAAAVTEAARRAGQDAGRAEGYAAAIAEASQLVDLIRRAADEGRQLRDQLAAEATPVVARATMYAVRRIVGEYYAEDPARTLAAVDDALRAVSGQQIVSIRVNPALADRLRARLVDAGRYLLPDEGVEIGGCVIDLAEGTLDATLDSRLQLMELALTRAAGENGP
jgi:flagellar biosynthesis/type III secretory pathway protein FliH